MSQVVTAILLAFISLLSHPNYKVRVAATSWTSWLNVTFDCRETIKGRLQSSPDEETRRRLEEAQRGYHKLNLKRVPTLTSLTGMKPGDPFWAQHFVNCLGGDISDYEIWQPNWRCGNPAVEGGWDKTEQAKDVEPDLVRIYLASLMSRWGLSRSEVHRIVRLTLETEAREPTASLVGSISLGVR